jgi:hypothetical protein
MSPGVGDTRRKSRGRSRIRPEHLAQLIHAHQEASLSHTELQVTHEAILDLLQGVATGEITLAHCVRLLRAQAVRFADAPVAARLYRQAATDLQRLQREEP